MHEEKGQGGRCSHSPGSPTRSPKGHFSANLKNHYSKMFGKKKKPAMEEGEINTSVFMTLVRYWKENEGGSRRRMMVIEQG